MRVSLAVVLLLLGHGGAAAQPATLLAPAPDQDEPAGAYASPSAIPEGPMDEKFGIPSSPRQSFDPIILPEGTASRLGGEELDLPALPAFAPQLLPSPNILRPENALVLDARLSADGELVPSGLVWRLFSPHPKADGSLQLVSVAKGGTVVFDVPAGPYLMHVGFGRAGLTKRIEFSGQRTHETVTLQAGGLRLDAVTGELPIMSDKLTFDVYGEGADERDRRLIADDVPAHVVIRLNEGDYHVVSNYGSQNAVVRADVRVEAGKISDVQLKHRAAEMTLKLVREAGGEAIADTAWSIASAQGDLIAESVGAFSSMVLAEGDYLVVAKNRERIYRREVAVKAGSDEEVELVVAASEPGEDTEIGSGD